MGKSYIHETAVIYEETIIGDNVYIGPNCIIGENSYQLRKNCRKPTIIGNNCKVLGGSVICRGAELKGSNRIDHMCYLGENAEVGFRSVIEYGARVYERVVIGTNTFVSGFVCNDVKIGSHCVIQGDLIHRFVDVNVEVDEASPVVENNVFVGRHAQVIGGIRLREGSYIGAGSVVTSSTENGKLYIGAPAEMKGNAPLFFARMEK